MMKKIVVALMCAVLVLCSLCACSSKDAGLLTIDEYAVYQDGEDTGLVDYNAEEVEMTSFAALERKHNPSTPYTTKRGITIGSSVEDIIEAYGNVQGAGVLVSDEIDIDKLAESKYKTINEYLTEFPAIKNGTVGFVTFLFNEKLYDSRSLLDLKIERKEGKAIHYALVFMIKDGKVISVAVSISDDTKTIEGYVEGSQKRAAKSGLD